MKLVACVLTAYFSVLDSRYSILTMVTKRRTVNTRIIGHYHFVTVLLFTMGGTDTHTDTRTHTAYFSVLDSRYSILTSVTKRRSVNTRIIAYNHFVTILLFRMGGFSPVSQKIHA